MQQRSKPQDATSIRRVWSKPDLKIADVKEITASNPNPGTESATMMAASDARLKRNIERLGQSPSGLPIYRFEYLWDRRPRVGVMAQDLLRLRPDAVCTSRSGFYMVDYARIDVKPLAL